jgi:hypothetical protein
MQQEGKMKVKFRHSETSKEHQVLATVGDFYILAHHPMNWSSDCYVAVKKSAVDVVPEPTYRAGQRFKTTNNTYYILVALPGQGFVLANLDNGWSTKPVIVKNPCRVTHEEVLAMADNCPIIPTK